MPNPVGRRKRPVMTRLAIEVECSDEFCYKCNHLTKKHDPTRQWVFVYCKFFKTRLSPARGESVAERCSDCHLAQRVAAGEPSW